MKFALALILVLCVSGSVYAMGEKSSSASGQSGEVASTDSVWIAKPDGSQSCSANSGTSLDAGAEDLKAAKIRVLSSHKASDAKLHMQLCGIPTGVSNVYEISRSDLARAIALGYHEQKIGK